MSLRLCSCGLIVEETSRLAPRHRIPATMEDAGFVEAGDFHCGRMFPELGAVANFQNLG